MDAPLDVLLDNLTEAQWEELGAEKPKEVGIIPQKDKPVMTVVYPPEGPSSPFSEREVTNLLAAEEELSATESEEESDVDWDALEEESKKRVARLTKELDEKFDNVITYGQPWTYDELKNIYSIFPRNRYQPKEIPPVKRGTLKRTKSEMNIDWPHTRIQSNGETPKGKREKREKKD